MQKEAGSMVHEGRNIKRIREIMGIKQETLALDLGISQQAISQLEQKEALDKDMLEKVAKALKIEPDVIKNYKDETIAFQIQNMHDHAQAIYQYNFNPLEKYIEATEQIKKLYEELLKVEREKIALLEKIMMK